MSGQNEAIEVTRLPSGLVVATERMERLETVAFGAYVAAGARHETVAENGIFHFLEHMAPSGAAPSPSPKRSRR
jgi:predicted Zn-dependent peptidase